MNTAAAIAVAMMVLALGGCGDGEDGSGGGGGLLAKHLYMGVSCREGNDMSCDGIAVSVQVPSRPGFVVAIVAGHRIRMDRIANGGRRWPIYQGRLESPGLLHEGPLAVQPQSNGKWLGQPQVRVPVTIQAIYGGGRYAERRFDGVTLGAGFG
jgi:hypothetical protein